ncbi:MAG: hypothetical protein JNK72_21220 [Myxococcales bacterium]|nr:hypothetical protein [Myxococcales bacterium]
MKAQTGWSVWPLVFLGVAIAGCSIEATRQRGDECLMQRECVSGLVCVLTSEGVSRCETPVRLDASVADTGPADTGPADTGPADTGPADTGPADTGPADTGSADTGPADTGPADAGVDVATGDVGGTG